MLDQIQTNNNHALRQVLRIGEGAINPEERIVQGEITGAQVEVFCIALENDFFVKEIVDTTTPDTCVDGRGFEVGGNAAGGTFTLVMADALTNQTLRRGQESAPNHARRFFTALTEAGARVGGHTGHAEGDNSGCGAEDKLDSQIDGAPSILSYIVRRGNDIRELLNSIGVKVSDEIHTKIVDNAAKLRAENYATNGKELEAVTKEIAGDDATPLLVGEHAEVALDIETHPGKTMDRQKIYAAYAGKMQAFHLDVWAVENGVKLLAQSEPEARERFVAALYYNVATACTLAKNVRIVTH